MDLVLTNFAILTSVNTVVAFKDVAKVFALASEKVAKLVASQNCALG